MYIYLACTLEKKEASSSVKAIDPRIKHFYWATIRCKMVDTLTGGVVFSFKKSVRTIPSGKLTETAAREEAVKKVSLKAAKLLLKRINSMLRKQHKKVGKK